MAYTYNEVCNSTVYRNAWRKLSFLQRRASRGVVPSNGAIQSSITTQLLWLLYTQATGISAD